MNVYIMRHADAVDGPVDEARALSAKGRNDALGMGKWLRDTGVGKPLIVSSPLARARESAALVAEALGGPEPEVDAMLACGMHPQEGAALIHRLGGSEVDGLVLVGHAPDVGGLISYLIGAKEPCVMMKKGALAKLSLERSGFGSAALHWLINPDLL